MQNPSGFVTCPMSTVCSVPRGLACGAHTRSVRPIRYGFVAGASSRPRYRNRATHAMNGASPLPELLDVGDPEFDSTYAFASYSNWLVPGRIMLGRYPFIEPSRCRTREMGEAQLRQILEAGIGTFVCLQDEVPPQDEMRVGGENGFLPYKATVELIAAAMAGPPSAAIVNGLRNPTLDKFLPPRRNPRTAQETPKIELKFLHNPIVDLGVPSTEKLANVLEDLEARVSLGENLYIHCWGGRGRAGTVGSCLLARLYGLSGEEALNITSLAFQTRGDGVNQSPETAEQVQLVKDFVRSQK
ncbi:hypothetical protein BSKO_10264 [Bryopsis sp. KO-2023]|nr:hypothetical protein BSKO_10264 [Bryopsis sp. KO-2023]